MTIGENQKAKKDKYWAREGKPMATMTDRR